MDVRNTRDTPLLKSMEGKRGIIDGREKMRYMNKKREIIYRKEMK